ncbi:MAG: hypothetical protein HY695_31760 [Deltaproteobacteria bacterium]|nr:hypothetical protein [Deltaproteobacteria bacterium]
MSRSYDMHGICALQKRQKQRRNGPIDRRTRSGKRAESLRAKLIADKGGQDASTVTLATIELAVRDACWLDEIDEALEAFKKKNPNIIKNPRALAKLYSYRQLPASSLVKNLGILGPERIPRDVPTLQEVLATLRNGHGETMTGDVEAAHDSEGSCDSEAKTQ